MNLEIITNKVIEIAKEAGNIIKENIGKISESDIESKGLNDFVTNIDKKSEKIIIEFLKDLIPEAGFITEEDKSLITSEKYNWVIDPLDGTTNFIHGLFPCAVSIGLIDTNEIVLGVVYEIGLDECFYAYKDSGAFLNGKQIKVSENKTLRNSLIATGFPYNEFSRLDEYIELFKDFSKNAGGLRRLGSAATDLAYVACGRFEGFYEYDLKPYDVAAGSIIVKEAGGKLCDFKGGNNYIFGKEIVASNFFIFDEFKNKIIKFMDVKK